MTHPPVPIKNVAPFLDAVGAWNLYDSEIRGVRLSANGGASPRLELDFHLHVDNVKERAPDAAESEYVFVFCFHGVAAIELAGFGEQFVVGEHSFEGDSSGIYVSIDSVSGGIVRFTCRSIELRSATEQPVAAA